MIARGTSAEALFKEGLEWAQDRADDPGLLLDDTDFVWTSPDSELELLLGVGDDAPKAWLKHLTWALLPLPGTPMVGKGAKMLLILGGRNTLEAREADGDLAEVIISWVESRLR